jgi:hypothetical protein
MTTNAARPAVAPTLLVEITHAKVRAVGMMEDERAYAVVGLSVDVVRSRSQHPSGVETTQRRVAASHAAPLRVHHEAFGQLHADPDKESGQVSSARSERADEAADFVVRADQQEKQRIGVVAEDHAEFEPDAELIDATTKFAQTQVCVWFAERFGK